MTEKINIFQKEVLKTLNQHDEILNLTKLKGRSVIFVLDMVNGFCHQGNLSSPVIKAIIPAIKTFLQTAIANKIEIIALNDNHSANNPEFKSYPSHCLENSLEANLVSELQFPEIKIIKKNSTNGFYALDINQKLNWNNIIIVGCCTDICVYQFALTCKTWANQHNQDVNVIVAKTMTTTFDSPEHPSDIINALFWHSMAKNGIKLVKDIKK